MNFTKDFVLINSNIPDIYHNTFRVLSISGTCNPSSCIIIDVTILAYIYVGGYLMCMLMNYIHEWRIKKFRNEKE